MDLDEYIKIPSEELENYRKITDGIVRVSNNGNWVKLEFLEWVTEDEDYGYFSKVWQIEGPGGKDHPLREGRHSNFGDEGYIFYLNKQLMLDSLEIANEYFDMK